MNRNFENEWNKHCETLDEINNAHHFNSVEAFKNIYGDAEYVLYGDFNNVYTVEGFSLIESEEDRFSKAFFTGIEEAEYFRGFILHRFNQICESMNIGVLIRDGFEGALGGSGIKGTWNLSLSDLSEEQVAVFNATVEEFKTLHSEEVAEYEEINRKWRELFGDE